MKTKKELKEEYKQMKIPMGVFQIKNIKILIDDSIEMESKWNSNSVTAGMVVSKKIGMNLGKLRL